MKTFPFLLLLINQALYALPTGQSIEQGEAQFIHSPALLEVVASDRSIINWDEFSIKANETARFTLPHSSSSTVSRVMSAVPSELMGRLESNGQVVLINQNGILVGKEASIHTASFIASSLDINNEFYLANGKLQFSGDLDGIVLNEGDLNAEEGDLFLVGPNVENRGSMQAKNGSAGILATKAVSFGGKTVYIQTRWEDTDPENPFSGAFKRETPAAMATQAGDIAAKDIWILGDWVHLAEESLCNADGLTGGGHVFVGGDYQGQNPLIANAKRTYGAPTSRISADAIERGDGGRVIIWGDEAAHFYGEVFAKGGKASGDGGFVEISSPQWLIPEGKVFTTAENGKTGRLLLDPTQITIAAATVGVALGNCGFSATTYASNVAAGTLNVATLNAQLGATNVTITTSDGTCGPFAGTGDIIINGTITWPVGAVNSLTLQAVRDITLNAAHPITTDAATTGSITFTAGRNILTSSAITHNGTGGIALTGAGTVIVSQPVSITPAAAVGNIAFTSTASTITTSRPILNAGSGNITYLATGTITTNGTSSITGNGAISLTSTAANISPTLLIQNTGTGSITLTAQANINVNAAINNTLATGGNITLNAVGNIIENVAGVITNASTGGDTTLTAGGTISIAATLSHTNAAATGNVTLTAPGTVTTTAGITYAGTGGAMGVTSTASSISIGGVITRSSAGAAPNLTLNAATTLTTTAAGVITNAGTSGNLGATSGGATTIGGNITYSAAAGVGNISLTSGSDISFVTSADVRNSGTGSVILIAPTGNTITINSASNVGSQNGLTIVGDPAIANRCNRSRPDIIINGGASTTSSIGVFNTAVVGFLATGPIDVACRNLSLLSGSGIGGCYVGHVSLSGQDISTDATAIITVDASGNILLNSSNTAPPLGFADSSIGHGGHFVANTGNHLYGDICVSAVGTITLQSPVLAGAATTGAKIGHGSNANAISVLDVRGNITVQAGGDITLNNQTLPVGGTNLSIGHYCFSTQSNAAGDINILTSGSLNLLSADGNNLLYIGHNNFSNAPIPTVNSNLFISVQNDFNFGAAANPLLTTRACQVGCQATALVGGVVEILVNGNFNAYTSGSTLSAIHIGNNATMAAVAANTNIAVQGTMTISPTALIGRAIQIIAPGDVNVAVAGSIDATGTGFVSAPQTESFISTRNFTSGTTRIFALGHIHSNLNGAVPFLFGNTAVPQAPVFTGGSLLVKAGTDLIIRNGFTTASGNITMASGQPFAVGGLWTLAASQLATICGTAVPALPVSACVACNPVAVILPVSSAAKAQTVCSALTFPAANSYTTTTGNLSILSSCDATCVTPITIGAAGFVQIPNPVGSVQISGFSSITLNQSLATTSSSGGSAVLLSTCGNLVVGANTISSALALATISLIADSDNSGAGNLSFAANVTSNNGLITLTAGSGAGAAATSSILQTGGTITSAGGAVTAQAALDITFSGTSPILLNTGGGALTATANFGAISIDENILTGGGNADFTAGTNILVNPPGGMSVAGGSVATGAGHLNMTAPNNITVNGDAVSLSTTTGNMNLNADSDNSGAGNLLLQQTISTTSGSITLAAGAGTNAGTSSILQTGGQILSTLGGTVIAQAALDITFSGASPTTVSTGGGALTATANTGTITIDENILTGGGNADFTAGTNILVNPPGGMSVAGGSVATAAGHLNMTAINNITVNGDAVSLSTTTGNMNLNADSDNSGAGNLLLQETISTTSGSITLAAGAGTNAGTSSILQTGGQILSTLGGTVTAQAALDITFSGASPTTVSTGGGALTATANTGTITIDENILTGGGNADFTAGTNILVNPPGGMSVAGGSVATAAGHLNMTALNNITVNGDAVSLSTTTGNMNLNADSDNSGAGNLLLQETISTTTGNITLAAGAGTNAGTSSILQTGGQILSTAGGTVIAQAALDITFSGTSPTTVSTGGGALTATANTGTITIDENILTGGGNADFTAGTDILVNPPGGTSVAGGSVATAAGHLNMTAINNITVNGDATSLSTTSGDINVIADSDNSGFGNLLVQQSITSSMGGNICLEAGAGTFGCSNQNCKSGLISGFPVGSCTVSILGGTASSSTGTINVVSAKDIIINGASPSIQTAGAIGLTAGLGNLAVDQQVRSTGGPITTFAGNDTILTQGAGPALIHAAGEIRMITGLNMTLNAGTAILSDFPGDEVTIIVDNIHPSQPVFPAAQSGSLTMKANSSMTSGSPLRIFSAYSQAFLAGTGVNSIDPTARLNGVNPFAFGYPTAPGNNTPYEQFCVFFGCPNNYPSPNLGDPFTFFYKVCVQLLARQANIIVSQQLQQFQSFRFPIEWGNDEYWGWPTKFALFYDLRRGQNKSNSLIAYKNHPPERYFQRYRRYRFVTPFRDHIP